MKKFLKVLLIILAVIAVILLVLFILDKTGRGFGIFSHDKIRIPEFNYKKYDFDFVKQQLGLII